MIGQNKEAQSGKDPYCDCSGYIEHWRNASFKAQDYPMRKGLIRYSLQTSGSRVKARLGHGSKPGPAPGPGPGLNCEARGPGLNSQARCPWLRWWLTLRYLTLRYTTSIVYTVVNIASSDAKPSGVAIILGQQCKKGEAIALDSGPPSTGIVGS